MGLSDKPVEYLVRVAHSWLEAPELKVVGGGLASEGYSRDQRAFLLTRQGRREASLEFELPASKKSPVVNPAFVIKNWGGGEPRMKVNGRRVKRGDEFRFGYHHTLEGCDLIIWLKLESAKPVRISLSPHVG